MFCRIENGVVVVIFDAVVIFITVIFVAVVAVVVAVVVVVDVAIVDVVADVEVVMVLFVSSKSFSKTGLVQNVRRRSVRPKT